MEESKNEISQLRGRPGKKKDSIIEAALTLFVRHGVTETKMIHICKEAGVSHNLFLYHYSSIDEVFKDVVKLILNELISATVIAIDNNQSDPIKLLRAYIDAPYIWAIDNEEKAKLWIYFYYISCVHEDFRKINSDIRKIGRKRIEQIIYHGVAKKVFLPLEELDLENTLISIQGLITGNFIMALSEENVSLKEASDATFSMISKHLIKSKI